METKPLLLVDALADEALAGVPVPVVPEKASTGQLRAIADEFGADGAVSLDDDGVCYVERRETHGLVEAAVAGWTGLLERDLLDGEAEMSVVGSDGTEQAYPVEHDDSRDVRVELPDQDIEAASISLDRLAPALDADLAALEEVGDELPVSRSEQFGGTLFVPVGFLDGLSSCSPDRETLAAVLAETETARMCAFTFDTLARRADLHARVFDPAVPACERAASGVAIAGCGQYLSQHDAFDGGIDTLRVECGYFLDRPGTVETTLGSSPRVGGRGLSVLDTTISVPEADDDDDIIEV
jgi:trans-2,3-dihydro-3-hydroxyanthranilate isomerase